MNMKHFLHVNLLAAVIAGTALHLPAQVGPIDPADLLRTSLRPQQSGGALGVGAVMQFRGQVQKLQSGSILLTLDDSRPLLLKGSGKTKYVQNAGEVKPSALKVGDWVTVEAALDTFSQLQALTVNILPASEAGEIQAESPASDQVSAGGNGRYTLLRGPSPRGPGSDPAGNSSSSQPPTGLDPEFLIERARIAANSFAGTLPNFIAQEAMTRYLTNPYDIGWRMQDVISVEVVYEEGKERHRNVRINEAPTTKTMEDLGGSWSTGEFASTLSGLLDERTNANFTWAGQATEKRGASEFRTAVFNFAVSEQNSRWHVSSTDDSSSGPPNRSNVQREIMPAYRGAVWIDIDSARVLRIEMAATSLPFDYPLNAVESAVDYAMVQIGDQPTLLPTRAESLACQRGTSNCSRNVIDFRRYKKFTTDAVIDFGEASDLPESNDVPQP